MEHRNTDRRTASAVIFLIVRWSGHDRPSPILFSVIICSHGASLANWRHYNYVWINVWKMSGLLPPYPFLFSLMPRPFTELPGYGVLFTRSQLYCIFHKKNQGTLFNLNDVMYSGVLWCHCGVTSTWLRSCKWHATMYGCRQHKAVILIYGAVQTFVAGLQSSSHKEF